MLLHTMRTMCLNNVCVVFVALLECISRESRECYLSEIEEETGVLAGLGEVGEKHCDTDEEHRGVLAHLTQRLAKRTQERFNLLHSLIIPKMRNVGDICT